jgi:hypothetical protein
MKNSALGDKKIIMPDKTDLMLKFCFVQRENLSWPTNLVGQGTYIKTVLQDLKKDEHAPLNEHLTIQITSQLHRTDTDQNALIFFENSAPADITNRFDTILDGRKSEKVEFATLSGKRTDNHRVDSNKTVGKAVSIAAPENMLAKIYF